MKIKNKMCLKNCIGGTSVVTIGIDEAAKAQGK